jgi:hypothetical protein
MEQNAGSEYECLSWIDANSAFGNGGGRVPERVKMTNVVNCQPWYISGNARNKIGSLVSDRKVLRSKEPPTPATLVTFRALVR